jgi:hypothetical protein
MIHFPACTLQQAADHGERLSKFFDTKMLKAPQSLAFEKGSAHKLLNSRLTRFRTGPLPNRFLPEKDVCR